MLGEEIGRGGMAVVYRALDTTLNRQVAVKLLHTHLCGDEVFLDRFLEMERRVARLWHPHLATTLDAGRDDGMCFVVMEDVGESLRRRLEKTGPLPIAEGVRLTAELAGALQYLHDEGIVHGDVKPDNVLLGEHGEAKLSDFGIAQLTGTGAAFGDAAGSAPKGDGGAVDPVVDGARGTAAYLAPEQLEKGHVNARSDLYALGLVAYEMLAGKRPFESEHWAAAVTQRLVREPGSLTEARADVPPGVAAAIARALSRDPEARFATAHEFRDALADGVVGQPAQPGPSVDPDATTAAVVVAPMAAPDETALFAARAIPSVSTTRPTGRSDMWRQMGPRAGVFAGRASLSLRSAFVALDRGLQRRLEPRLGRLDRLSRGALWAGLAFGLLILLIGLPGLLNPPGPVRLASVAGQPLAEARAAASGVGAQVRVVETSSDSVPKGHVVRQEPGPNATFRSDRPVTLYVSSGPPPVRVPDLRDRRLEDARKDLETAGLAMGNVQERETPRRPWGTVVGQSTRAGAMLSPGSGVNVVVGSPPYTHAPAIAGRSLGEAEAELHKKGLVLGEVRQEAAGGKRAGTVLTQEPAGGVRLRQGEGVAVTIAVPPKPGQ